MSIWKKIGLVTILTVFIILILYAAAPTRPFIEGALIGPLGLTTWSAWEGTRVGVTQSQIWIDYGYFITAITFSTLTGFLAWFVHSGYNRTRQYFVRSAANEVTGGAGARAPISEPRTITPSYATTRPTSPIPETQPIPEQPTPTPPTPQEEQPQPSS